MKLSRVVLALALGGVAVMSMASTTALADSHARPVGDRTTHHRASQRHRISWKERDRTVYAVSTLNAPLCPNGQQLATVLRNQDGARLFDVLKSMADSNLYYIQVRDATKRVLGVYAYRFGWKLPQGVRKSKCVSGATTAVDSSYRLHQWRWEARFRTTFPQR